MENQLADYLRSGLGLEDLLPHRGDLLLIDEILSLGPMHAVTRSKVRPGWPLAGEEGVQALVLIEVAAQTAGVCNGWDRIRTQGVDSDQMGWLVAVKRAEFFRDLLPLGRWVRAYAENTYNFENLREIDCRLHLDDLLVGTATLQLFQERKS